MNTAKEEAIRIILNLPEQEMGDVVDFLKAKEQRFRLPRVLAEAPEDDEPVIPEEEAKIAASRDAYKRGETVSWEEVQKEIGL